MIATVASSSTQCHHRVNTFKHAEFCVLLACSSRTAMIATVALSSIQYHHTVNTLKYADRAKEIKTHVRQNAGTVQEHVAQYQAIIDDLREENDQLKRELNVLQV